MWGWWTRPPLRKPHRSWMNLVERFCRDLTDDAVRDGSFASVAELVRAIEGYLAERNLTPKRYVWKAAGRDILLKSTAPASPPVFPNTQHRHLRDITLDLPADRSRPKAIVEPCRQA